MSQQEATDEMRAKFNRERDMIVKDIQASAEKALTDPLTFKALSRVGLDKPFATADLQHIDGELGLGTAFADHGHSMAVRDYRNLALALARRVAVGLYSSVSCHEATNYVRRNTFPEPYYGAPYGTPNEFRPLENMVSIEDMILIVRELSLWRDYDKYIQAYRDHSRAFPGEQPDNEILKPIYDKEFEIKQRHGLVGLFSPSSVIAQMKHKGLDIMNADQIRQTIEPISEVFRVRF